MFTINLYSGINKAYNNFFFKLLLLVSCFGDFQMFTIHRLLIFFHLRCFLYTSVV
jgi:hypothetical protein